MVKDPNTLFMPFEEWVHICPEMVPILQYPPNMKLLPTALAKDIIDYEMI